MKKMSKSMFSALEQDAENRLKRELFDDFRNNQDGIADPYSDAEVHEIIDYGIKNAKKFKIESDLGFAAFITLMFACSAEFHQEPEIREHLSEGDDPDASIIDLADYYLNQYEE